MPSCYSRQCPYVRQSSRFFSQSRVRLRSDWIGSTHDIHTSIRSLSPPLNDKMGRSRAWGDLGLDTGCPNGFHAVLLSSSKHISVAESQFGSRTRDISALAIYSASGALAGGANGFNLGWQSRQAALSCAGRLSPRDTECASADCLHEQQHYVGL
jgi:hypothetical protein